MDAERKPWDQQAGESDEQYAQFLIYRNLGPARSLDVAYRSVNSTATNRDKSRKGKKTSKNVPTATVRASGQWAKNATAFNWAERAAAWDVDMLKVTVPNAVAAVFQAIDDFAKVTIIALQSGSVKPRTWAQAMGAIQILAGFISPETARNAMDRLRRTGDATEDASATKPNSSV